MLCTRPTEHSTIAGWIVTALHRSLDGVVDAHTRPKTAPVALDGNDRRRGSERAEDSRWPWPAIRRWFAALCPASAPTCRAEFSFELACDTADPLIKTGPGGSHIHSYFTVAPAAADAPMGSSAGGPLPRPGGRPSGGPLALLRVSSVDRLTPADCAAESTSLREALRANGLRLSTTTSALERWIAVRDAVSKAQNDVDAAVDPAACPSMDMRPRGIVALAHIRAAATAWRRRSATRQLTLDGSDTASVAQAANESSTRRSRRRNTATTPLPTSPTTPGLFDTFA